MRRTEPDVSPYGTWMHSNRGGYYVMERYCIGLDYGEENIPIELSH